MAKGERGERISHARLSSVRCLFRLLVCRRGFFCWSCETKLETLLGETESEGQGRAGGKNMGRVEAKIVGFAFSRF